MWSCESSRSSFRRKCHTKKCAGLSLVCFDMFWFFHCVHQESRVKYRDIWLLACVHQPDLTNTIISK
jgi:hypothetical protein